MTDAGIWEGKREEFVRRCFRDGEVARAFLRHYLPKELVGQLDLDRVVLHRGAYVDEEFHQSYGDLSYRIPLREQPPTDATAGVYVCVLAEYKTESDQITAFQPLRYMVQMWDRQLKAAGYPADFRLPPIITLVLRRGEATSPPVEFRELGAAPPGLEAVVPNFRCILVNMAALRPEDLASTDERVFILFSTLRSAFMGEEIDAALEERVVQFIEPIRKQEIRKTLVSILDYALQCASDLTDEGFLQAVEGLGEMRDDIMSALIGKWMAEGRRDSIVDVLVARFDSVPEGLREALRTISDSERLVRLTATAATCESVEQFAENLK